MHQEWQENPATKLKIHESVFSYFYEVVQYNTCPMVCLDKKKQGSWNTWKPFDSE